MILKIIMTMKLLLSTILCEHSYLKFNVFSIKKFSFYSQVKTCLWKAWKLKSEISLNNVQATLRWKKNLLKRQEDKLKLFSIKLLISWSRLFLFYIIQKGQCDYFALKETLAFYDEYFFFLREKIKRKIWEGNFSSHITCLYSWL